MKVLVMGGSRFMGRAVVHRLLDQNHSVTVFNRGTRVVEWPGPVTELQGDRNSSADLKPLADLALDGVIDLSAYTPHQTEMLLNVLGDVLRFVHCSSGAVYAPQPELPWPESTPYGPWPLWGTYGRDKLGCEQVLQAARTHSRATTVIRMPYVLGPANYADREEFVLNRLLDGAEILVPGDGQAVQQFLSTTQVGYAMVAALETFLAGGWQAFNIASPTFVSLRGFIEICAAATGTTPILRCVDTGAAGTATDVFSPANAVFPFPNVNYVLDLEASVRAGIAPPPISLASMIADSLQALISSPERRQWTRTKAEMAHLQVER
jgi:2'-hydroxyisoflavone reductase